ncbi:MAG: hypothetical protein AAGG08_16470, partial [Actinomycetota bacterium]
MDAHPLDPATADELASAVAILRSADQLSDRAFFTFGHRVEPSRDELRRADAGESIDRMISLVGHDPTVGKSFDARVSVGGGGLFGVDWQEHGQAPVNEHDVFNV